MTRVEVNYIEQAIAITSSHDHRAINASDDIDADEHRVENRPSISNKL